MYSFSPPLFLPFSVAIIEELRSGSYKDKKFIQLIVLKARSPRSWGCLWHGLPAASYHSGKAEGQAAHMEEGGSKRAGLDLLHPAPLV